MPLYEYKCGSCGETFEVIQKFSDEPLKVHEKCGGGPVERLISPAALQFKGSGWYVTDYGSSKNGKSTEAKAAKDGKKESKGSTDSSTKPESKNSSSTPASTSDKKV